MRRFVRASIFGLSVALSLVTSASSASAHAYLDGSDPADGAVLQNAPSALTLHFSESVEVGATVVQLVDGHGRHLPAGPIRRLGLQAESTEQPVSIVVSLPAALPRDTYRLTWRTLSSDDLHATAGAMVFGIQQPVTAIGTSETPAQPFEVSLRWLTLLGLSLLAGGWILSRLADHKSPEEHLVSERAVLLASLGGLVAFFATGALLVDLLIAAPRGRWSVLAASAPRWSLTFVGLGVATAAAAAAKRRLGRPAQDAQRVTALAITALFAGVLAIVGTALLSHAGAGRSSSAVQVAVATIHILAATSWVGTLLAAVLVGMLLRRRDQSPVSALVPAMRRFAPVAAACVATMVVTGLLLASELVATIDAALFSDYGRALLQKLLLAGAALMFGYANWRTLRHGDGPPLRRLRRTLAVEAALTAVILGFAATMASSAPARGPRWDQAPGGRPVPLQSVQVADLQETLSVKPNVPGRNVLSVAAYDTRRPSPGPVTGVELRLKPVRSSRAEVVRVALRTVDGRWDVAVDDLDAPGLWNVTVTVIRSGLSPTTYRYPWVVGGSPGALTVRTRVSDHPLRQPLRAAALTLTIAFMAVAAMTWRLRRRRSAGTGQGAGDAVVAAGQRTPVQTRGEQPRTPTSAVVR